MYIWLFSRSDGAGSATSAEDPRADALGERPDGASLAGAVAPLEHHDDPQALVLHPVLESAQLGLKPAQLLDVLLPLEPGPAILLLFLRHEPNPTLPRSRMAVKNTNGSLLSSRSKEKLYFA